jgi:TolB-like protein/DNA-binding winged helix-turn-helix (wHTH) protein
LVLLDFFWSFSLLSVSQADSKVFQFGCYRLEVGERLLFRDGQPVKLRPKLFDTLRLLVESHGHLVPKEDLLTQLWPDCAVEENNLAHNVAFLRKALGETATQKYIETVPRRGYRFVLEVTELKNEVKEDLEQANDILTNGQLQSTSAAEASDSRRRFSLPHPRPLHVVFGIVTLTVIAVLGSFVRVDRGIVPGTTDSLAVLPFVNFGTDPNIDHFSDGLTAEITTRLGTIQGLRVPSRVMMFQYKNNAAGIGRICKAAKVRTLLEGSVRSQGDRLLITVNRIDADGNHLWAETYDRVGGDLLAVQREVAARISEAVRKQLEGRQR